MALAGIETLHPDVFIVEERGIPRITGVGVSTGGFVGVAEKGPLDRAELVTNLTQFNQVYGGFFEGSYLEPSARAFFDQGGTRCFVVRIVGDGSTEADVALVNHEGMPSIDVNAISAGAWGNNVSLTTTRWGTSVAPSPMGSGISDVGNGSTQIPVFSLNDIVKETHQALHDDASGEYRIPDTREVLSQELFLFENSGSDDLARLVDPGHRRARLSIVTPHADGIVYRDFVREVETAFEDGLQGRANFVTTGGMALEVKRWGKAAALVPAIAQAEAQAVKVGGVPCVAYRMDGGAWRFLPVLTIEQFAQLVREGTCEDML